MDIQKECKRWVISHAVDPETKADAVVMLDDEEKLLAAFGGSLSFGTAGLRGIMGAGTNRMNECTVRQATRGLGNFISGLGADAMVRGVVIAHDCRRRGERFTMAAAQTLCAMGIKVYVFDELRPTPELSFAVRELGTIAGINITASHNPKEYNGYKVYFEDGAQISGEIAERIQTHIRAIDPLNVPTMEVEEAEKRGLLVYIGEEIDEKYLAAVLAESLDLSGISEQSRKLKVVYTPFHGTGYRLVPEALKRLSINVVPVEEQMIVSGEFPTVKSPNPEEKEGFAPGVKKAKEVGADLIIATDPDADRVGVGCLDKNGGITLLTGNQVGILLSDFIIRNLRETGKMPPNPAVITSIVSTRMVKEICAAEGVDYFEVLTGFKYIGEHIKQFEEKHDHSFIFGFEESYGYLKGSYARDKDSVIATVLIAQMAMYYKDQNKTLPEALEALYKKYGRYEEKVVSFKIGGTDPQENMKEMLSALRRSSPEKVAGLAVRRVGDFLTGEYTDKDGGTEQTGLPKSDMLHFTFEDGSVVIVRPSGTEPKVKLYILTRGKDKAACDKKIKNFEKEFGAMLQ